MSATRLLLGSEQRWTTRHGCETGFVVKAGQQQHSNPGFKVQGAALSQRAHSPIAFSICPFCTLNHSSFSKRKRWGMI
jgi:hypothetical protein